MIFLSAQITRHIKYQRKLTRRRRRKRSIWTTYGSPL